MYHVRCDQCRPRTAQAGWQGKLRPQYFLEEFYPEVRARELFDVVNVWGRARVPWNRQLWPSSKFHNEVNMLVRRRFLRLVKIPNYFCCFGIFYFFHFSLYLSIPFGMRMATPTLLVKASVLKALMANRTRWSPWTGSSTSVCRSFLKRRWRACRLLG